MGEPVVGVDASLVEALERAPVAEKSLFEASLRWVGSDPAELMVVERLRLFVHTWDPFRTWFDERDAASATVNGDGDDFEVVVWVPFTTVVREAPGGDLRRAGEVLARYGESAVVVGASLLSVLGTGAYEKLVREGKAAALLSSVAEEPKGLASVVSAESAGWEPMGLGAILDLVRAGFGPVTFDRSPVRLKGVASPVAGCPACSGRSFRFIADLSESAETMCSHHRAAAAEVIDRRFARARASNAEAYEAIIDASTRLSMRHVPEPIAIEIDAASQGWLGELEARQEQLDRFFEAFDDIDPDDLDAHRALLDEAELTRPDIEADLQQLMDLADRLLRSFEPDGEAFDEALDSDNFIAMWFDSVPLRLAKAGEIDAAVSLTDRVAAFGTHRGLRARAETAKAVIVAGHTDRGVAMAEQTLAEADDDAFTLALAGSAFLAANRDELAEQTLRRALVVADRHDDIITAEFAWADLVELLERQPGRERDLDLARTHLADVEESELARRDHRVTVTHLTPKTGRNDPCPCGSGQKYKKCCGR